MTEQTAFRVPSDSIGYWSHRLIEHGVTHGPLERRFGEQVLSFADPHGAHLALVGVADVATPKWSNGEIPEEHAIRGFHSVTLLLKSAEPTAAILTGLFDFRETAREGSLVRYMTNDGRVGNVVIIREAGNFRAGRMGRGSLHHVAFRAADDAAQAELAGKLMKTYGIEATPQMDRKYFRSVYFREPGGILFEVATDQPGFAVDEPPHALGRELKLPRFLEPRRREIEAALPALKGAEQAA
jgi:glyoxalase family protein